jgi:hypothetical protein
MGQGECLTRKVKRTKVEDKISACLRKPEARDMGIMEVKRLSE